MMDIKVATPVVGDDEVNAVEEVLRSGNYVSGEKVRQFELAFAKYVGVDHCVALSSGTDALILSLFGIGVRPGEEVIIPPLTFFATVAAVIHAGCRPVFADIDPDTYCIDPEDVAAKMTRRTTAIIPVHIYGQPCAMDELNGLVYEEEGGERVRRKPHVIEDAAQAHGAEYKGKKAGNLGDLACWSFYATKNMTTGEEGGAITTNNGYAAKRIEALRNHGMADRNTHVFVGYNNRMSEIGGAIGLVQLKKLDKMNEARSINSLYLMSELGKLNLSWLKLPQLYADVTHSWFWFPILIDEDELGLTTLQLREGLQEEGIGTRHRYLEPLYKQPALRPYGRHYENLHLPNAEEICGHMLGLPNHPLLSEEELNYIVNIFKEMK